jgi:hypothetical protein
MNSKGLLESELKNISLTWKYYLQSDTRNASTKRYKEKCKFCSGIIESKAEQMSIYSTKCSKTTPEAKL